MKIIYQDLQKKIKVKFKDLDLLIKSLTHKSFDPKNNNEKIEFLGDRVLGLVIAKKLLEIYPDEKEGILDKKFAALVNKKTCLLIAKNLDLQKYILVFNSKHKTISIEDKVISDACEALIGAIYLDQGIEASEKFILNNWKDYINKSEKTLIDAKTKLQEYSLKKYKVLPKYKMQKQAGPQHSPIFKVDVQIPNSKKYSASGNSKKDAQQNAAKKLLFDLKV